jgi:hypothetical protein
MSIGSANIISAFVSSIQSFLTGEAGVVVEGFFIEAGRLEAEGDLNGYKIPRARVSIFEDGDDPNIVVDRMNTMDVIQRYAVEINYVVGYKEDIQTNVELPMYDLKDKMIEWARNTDIYTVSGQLVYYLQYTGSASSIRNVRFVTIRLNFEGRRNLFA